ncbi:hypothetical protein E4U21_006798 [Claviceps maximensis]|nr:hypothetical protein E4U21_006798 [Claviceps maximensis]
MILTEIAGISVETGVRLLFNLVRRSNITLDSSKGDSICEQVMEVHVPRVEGDGLGDFDGEIQITNLSSDSDPGKL